MGLEFPLSGTKTIFKIPCMIIIPAPFNGEMHSVPPEPAPCLISGYFLGSSGVLALRYFADFRVLRFLRLQRLRKMGDHP
jgi:hypothetical protein